VIKNALSALPVRQADGAFFAENAWNE